MIRNLCTTGPRAPPAQLRAIVSAGRGRPPVFADPQPDRRGADGASVEDWSTESSASLTECHPRKFFFKSLPFGRVRRFSQPIHECKEPFLLGVFRVKTGLDQIDEHAIGACLPRPGQRAHTPRNAGRNGHTLTNRSFCFSHVNYSTPWCTRLHHLSRRSRANPSAARTAVLIRARRPQCRACAPRSAGGRHNSPGGPLGHAP